MKTEQNYQARVSLDQRIKKQNQLKEKQLIPIILQPFHSSDLPRLSAEAIGIFPTMKINDIKTVLRKTFKLDQSQALLIFHKKQILNDNSLLVDLYMMHKDTEDQFLYLYYSTLQAFGK